MARTTNDPALITTLTNGDAIANTATTPSEAGVTLTVATSGTGAVTFEDDRYRYSGTASVARMDETLSSFGLVQVEDLWNIPSAPTVAANRIYEFRHASNFACRVEQNTSRTIVILNSANTAIWTSSAVPLGEVRFRVTLDPDGTTAANGDFQIDIFTTNPRTSTTPDQTWSTSASDFTVNALTVIRRGRVSSTASSTATVELIYAQTEDSATPIGPRSADGAVTAVRATSTAAAGVPTVTGIRHATVTGVAATASALAQAPAVSAEVVVASNGPATATALASPPAVTGGAAVTGVKAAATALATPPVVSGAATVTAVCATAAAAAGTPAVSGSAATNVAAVCATATASAGVPVVIGGATVTVVCATATSSAGVPTVAGGATVIAVTATASAAAGVPTASGVSVTNVDAVRATATAAATAPTVSGGAAVTATAATSAAAAYAPAVGVSVTVVSVRATSTAAAYGPVVTGGADVPAAKAAATAVAYSPSAIGGAIVSTFVATSTAAAWSPVIEGRGLLDPPVSRFTTVGATTRVMTINDD